MAEQRFENLLGRIVLYVMAGGDIRPALVVRELDLRLGLVNLQVFTDGVNDGEKYESGMFHTTSIFFDDDERKFNTWHWQGDTGTSATLVTGPAAVADDVDEFDDLG